MQLILDDWIDTDQPEKSRSCLARQLDSGQGGRFIPATSNTATPLAAMAYSKTNTHAGLFHAIKGPLPRWHAGITFLDVFHHS
jgi:hypothetical protein